MFKHLPPHLRRVASEAYEQGSRSFTLTPDGRTLRIHLEPERPYIDGLKVFIAHATLDRPWADTVAEGLSALGFKVIYLPVGTGYLGSSHADIATALSQKVTDADYLCLLFSRNSANREWVGIEYAAAARTIGQVFLLRHPSVTNIYEFAKPRFAVRALLTTKYHLLDWREDSDMFSKLARLLINHPEEGVTDGTYRPLSIRERNLRRESIWRKHARAFLDTIPEYESRHVVDVIPFSWAEIGLKMGDVGGAFWWFVKNHGRLNMAVQVNRKRWHTSLIFMPVDETLKSWIDDSHLFAIVLWKPDWDPAQDEMPNNALV